MILREVINMNQKDNRKEKEEKKKKPAAWFLNKKFLGILLGLVGVTAGVLALQSGPASSENSSPSISPSSSSSTSSSSSISSASSTLASSNPSSSSSTSSSQVPAGSRLARLNPVGDFAIVISIKVAALEYFVWSDDNNFKVSVFDGQTLIKTDDLGSKSNSYFAPQAAAAYGSGILFSSQGLSSNTYIYDEEGTLTTLNNYSLLYSSNRVRQEGLFLVQNVTPTHKLVKLVAPSTTPLFVNNLPSTGMYTRFDDEFPDFEGNEIDFSANFRVMEVIDTSSPNFSRKFEFFTASNFTKVLESTFPLQNGLLVINQNGLFFANMMTQTVKYISAAGAETNYTQAMLMEFRQSQGVLVSVQSTRTVHSFFKGQLTQTFTNRIPFVMANSPEYGSSFILSSDNGNSFSVHYIDPVIGFGQTIVYLVPPPSLNTFGIPTYRFYNSIANITTVGYYNHGWTILEVPGQFDDGFTTFTTINDVNYAILIEKTPTATANTYLVKAFDGRPNVNTVYTTTITGIDVLGAAFIGVVNNYLLLTLSDNVTRTGTSFVVDLIDETYVTLPENIWYMSEALLLEDNGIIHGYGQYGAFSVDLNNIIPSFFTTSSGRNDDSEITYGSLQSDFFGEDDDVFFLIQSPFPNPTDTSTIEIYRGNIELGFESLTLLATYQTTENSFTQREVAFVGENIYAYYFYQFDTLITILGDAVSGNHYYQGDSLIAIDDELNETLISSSISSFSTPIF